MTVMTKPQQSVRLEPVHPKPEEAHTMPYAPAVRIVGACDLMFLSGATPSPLYHKHPHDLSEHNHPVGIANTGPFRARPHRRAGLSRRTCIRDGSRRRA